MKLRHSVHFALFPLGIGFRLEHLEVANCDLKMVNRVKSSGCNPRHRLRSSGELALLAKKLRLVIQAQLYAETGSVEGLMIVLSDLEKA